MKSFYKEIIGADKKLNNKWLSGFVIDNKQRVTCRSYSLWKSINGRCSERVWNIHPSYTGTKNLFNNFQAFTDWCNSQYGYYHKETNGNYWSIDKDIKKGKLNIYSEDTCMFIPNNINAFVLDSKKIRGDLPIGVIYRKKNFDMVNELKNPYLASCKSNTGRRIHLGYYPTATEAHKAWQIKKLEILNNIISDDKISNHLVLLESLNRVRNKLYADISNVNETVSLL